MNMNNDQVTSIQNSLLSENGSNHLSSLLSKEESVRALDFAATAGVYGYITNNAQQYVRDVQVFELLGDKFTNAGHFADSNTVQNWVTERLAINPDSNKEMLFRFFQGHGAGEVDAVRHMNGRLLSVLYRAEFPKDALGHIDPTTAGYDFNIVNRITGKVVEQVQVKANWSSDPAAWKATISKLLSRENYSPDHTLALPKEVAKVAKDMGVENRIIAISDVEGNRISAERLTQMAKNGDIATEGAITFQGVTTRIAQGAIVGAAVACGISAIGNYIAYRKGIITGGEAFRRIGVDSSKGAIVGGSLGGLSILFPPGVIGIGIGIAVGMQLRRLIDIAYGKGAYQDIVNSMGAVETSLRYTAQGVAVVEEATSYAYRSQIEALKELSHTHQLSCEVDNDLDRLKKFEMGE